MQLLVDANKRLAAMQDPSVFHIRTAISEDIASLRVIKQPNTDDIYLTLSGLLNQVEQLPFAQVYIPDLKQQVEQSEQVSGEINDWQHNLAVSAQRFFAHFITIRKQETQVQPQLPAKQQWYVRANLTTQILMAQNAVLDKDQPRYIDALKTVNRWSQEYFDRSKPEVVAFVNGLEHLTKQNVELAVPTGLATQPLIANYVVEQLRLKEETND
jgi:uroporphyrin-3 C-methyltransferase